MTHTLTAAQRQALVQVLQERRGALQQELLARRQGQTRAEQALSTREGSGNDALQMASEREVLSTLTDIEGRELQALDAALRRAQEGDYGLCIDCGRGIPFARLQVEPQALRCVACESQRERR